MTSGVADPPPWGYTFFVFHAFQGVREVSSYNNTECLKIGFNVKEFTYAGLEDGYQMQPKHAEYWKELSSVIITSK